MSKIKKLIKHSLFKIFNNINNHNLNLFLNSFNHVDLDEKVYEIILPINTYNAYFVSIKNKKYAISRDIDDYDTLKYSIYNITSIIDDTNIKNINNLKCVKLYLNNIINIHNVFTYNNKLYLIVTKKIIANDNIKEEIHIYSIDKLNKDIYEDDLVFEQIVPLYMNNIKVEIINNNLYVLGTSSNEDRNILKICKYRINIYGDLIFKRSVFMRTDSFEFDVFRSKKYLIIIRSGINDDVIVEHIDKDKLTKTYSCLINIKNKKFSVLNYNYTKYMTAIQTSNKINILFELRNRRKKILQNVIYHINNNEMSGSFRTDSKEYRNIPYSLTNKPILINNRLHFIKYYNSR